MIFFFFFVVLGHSLKKGNKLIGSENKNKPITNKLKGVIFDNGTKILMISKLNILINPCTKINKLLGIVEEKRDFEIRLN